VRNNKKTSLRYTLDFDPASGADPHSLDADPDPAFHLDADPDPTFHFDADPNPNPTF
jgi:hypothetical protein